MEEGAAEETAAGFDDVALDARDAGADDAAIAETEEDAASADTLLL